MTKRSHRRCEAYGRRLSAKTFRGELDEGRCDLRDDHDSPHVSGGCALDPYEGLTDAQWDAMDKLSRGERVLIHPTTRNWLKARGWITLHGHSNLSTSARITDKGRAALARSYRKSDMLPGRKTA